VSGNRLASIYFVIGVMLLNQKTIIIEPSGIEVIMGGIRS